MSSTENDEKSTIENLHDLILNTINVNEEKTSSVVNDPKTNDKIYGSKQTEKSIGLLYATRIKNNLCSRYKLTTTNYIPELHRALLKECNDNLLDFKSLNASLDFESLTNVTNRTFKAIKEQKVFSVLGYFPKIVEEMKNRGWVEKRNPLKPPINYVQYSKSKPYMVNWIESPPIISSMTENEVIWERLKNVQSWNILKYKRSDFIFVTRKHLVNWSTLHKLTSVSQMRKHLFCSKNGLIQCLEPLKNVESNLMFPRCHYIRCLADYNEFLEDYIITALVGTLKIIVQSIEENRRIFSEEGNIPCEIIKFVHRCVLKFLDSRQSGSTETDMWKFNSQKDIWDEFLNHYTQLINNDDVTIQHEYSYQLEKDVYAKCKYLLENVKVYCPQHFIDGNTNTWIIKPMSNCSGHGIIMSRDINTIKEKVFVSEGFRSNYILQKYIEKPLLIYTCKIDLRQWFLVTNMTPIVVWMYKEGYVRFCANSFSMKHMHESIHLSNVRLQMRYRNIRKTNVPEECMWDYKTLQTYLTTIGQEHAWDELIFPGMSESVYAVMQTARDTMSYRENTFQLFGADFVITENFVPYLIEINSIPGLNPSTCVIANLAPMLLGDIVKVMIDHQQNPNADTGLFVKVVPEILKPIDKLPSKNRTFAPPNITPSERHQKRMDELKKRLMAIQVISEEKFTDRYLGFNRDNLLMTTIMSTDPIVDSTKTAETASETIVNDTQSSAAEKIAKLKNVYTLKSNNFGLVAGSSAQPDDDRQRER